MINVKSFTANEEFPNSCLNVLGENLVFDNGLNPHLVWRNPQGQNSLRVFLLAENLLDIVMLLYKLCMLHATLVVVWLAIDFSLIKLS